MNVKKVLMYLVNPLLIRLQRQCLKSIISLI